MLVAKFNTNINKTYDNTDNSNKGKTEMSIISLIRILERLKQWKSNDRFTLY